MNKIANSSGFTLIEVMIAIFILTVGLLGAAGMAATVINGNAFSKEITTAAMLAQDKMEELRTVDWNGLQDGNDTISGSQGIRYQRTWTVAPTGTMKAINLAVNWNDGHDHSIQITSVITN